MTGQRRMKAKSAAVDEEWAWFGGRVGELREKVGLSHQDLTMREVCDVGTLRRIEDGSFAPPRHLATYLDSKLDGRGSLVNAWARARINTHLATAESPDELDHAVGTLREFHPGAIPAPLRCHSYAKALGRFQGKPDHHRSRHGRNLGTELRVVINESVLRTPVGGVEVMREQMTDLISAADHHRTRVHVIPSATVAHPCTMGPFRLLTLGPAYTVAHLLSPVGEGQIITRPDQVRAFADVFEDLCGAALPITESRQLLVEVRDVYKRALKAGTERKEITSGPENSQGGVLVRPQVSYSPAH